MSQSVNAAAAATARVGPTTYTVRCRIPGYDIEQNKDVYLWYSGCVPPVGEKSILDTCGVIRLKFVDSEGQQRDIAGATWAEVVEETV